MRKGTHMSVESRALISFKMRGRRLKPEHTEKIRLALAEKRAQKKLLRKRLFSLIQILEERVDPASPLAGLVCEVGMLSREVL